MSTWSRWIGAWAIMAGAMAAAPAAGAVEQKVGYVILAKVIDGYQRTKQSDAKFTERSKQKEGEMQARVNELKKLRESLELLSDQAREAKAREIEQKSDDLQRFRNAATRDLNRERQKLMGEIAADVQRAVGEFAKANGFTLIVKDEALLYGETSHDVTDQILASLNAKFAGGAAPAGKKDR